MVVGVPILDVGVVLVDDPRETEVAGIDRVIRVELLTLNGGGETTRRTTSETTTRITAETTKGVQRDSGGTDELTARAEGQSTAAKSKDRACAWDCSRDDAR